MATQLELFRLIAPEFAGQSDVTVQSFFDIAPLFVNVDLYPADKKDAAIVYQAASLMYQQSLSASGHTSGGLLRQEKEGDLERQYNNSQTSSRFGAKDQYLIMLDRLSLGVVGLGAMTRMIGEVPAP